MPHNDNCSRDEHECERHRTRFCVFCLFCEREKINNTNHSLLKLMHDSKVLKVVIRSGWRKDNDLCSKIHNFVRIAGPDYQQRILVSETIKSLLHSSILLLEPSFFV